nr:hypothetical protein [Actinopolyspora biskrensis]
MPGLAARTQDHLRQWDLPGRLKDACSCLPRRCRTPAEAHDELVRDRLRRVPLEKLHHSVAASMVVPVPPGAPILMPGEATGPRRGAFTGYLFGLRDFDRSFPGFEHDVRGLTRDRSGEYWIDCLRDASG